MCARMYLDRANYSFQKRKFEVPPSGALYTAERNSNKVCTRNQHPPSLSLELYSYDLNRHSCYFESRSFKTERAYQINSVARGQYGVGHIKARFSDHKSTFLRRANLTHSLSELSI